jgi:hypothetical protein
MAFGIAGCGPNAPDVRFPPPESVFTVAARQSGEGVMATEQSNRFIDFTEPGSVVR